MNKTVTIIFVYNAERYKRTICDTREVLRDEIERRLYILWEMTPVNYRRWMRELEDFGSTTYTYHGTEFNRVTMRRDNNTITIMMED